MELIYSSVNLDKLGYKNGFLTKKSPGNHLYHKDSHDYLSRTFAQKLFSDNNKLCLIEQVHGNKITLISAAQLLGQSSDIIYWGQYDGMATDQPGLTLAIQTADCLPILLAHRSEPFIFAIHAGWRGVWGGIIEESIIHITNKGFESKDFIAVIGPAIHQNSYQVDLPFYNNFCSKRKEASRFFKNSQDGFFNFDLPGIAEYILNKSGIEVEIINYDTYSNPNLFYSYRLAQHQGSKEVKRNLSLISIN